MSIFTAKRQILALSQQRSGRKQFVVLMINLYKQKLNKFSSEYDCKY